MKDSADIEKMTSAKWDKIIVPVDFSKNCLPALKLGASLAKANNAELHVIHAAEMVYATGFEFSAALPIEKDLLAHAEKELSQLISKNIEEGVNVTQTIRSGQAYRCVVDYADEIDADLIAITTHGYTGLRHLALGSVAERIVRHASVPVLVLPIGDL